MARKISEIIIEIAKLGLKDEKMIESEVMHILFFLAHIAWNRDTKSSDYFSNGKYISEMRKFKISKTKIKKELISDNWEVIISKMLKYKQDNYLKDKRIITLIGYTPWETLRVEWE